MRNRRARVLALAWVTMLLATALRVSGVNAAQATTVNTGSLDVIARATGARDMWACGWTGAGVDIALIDTGVAPVPGMGPIINGPDLSFDFQSGAPAYLDAFGHGTHMASVMNGRDADFKPQGTCPLNGASTGPSSTAASSTAASSSNSGSSATNALLAPAAATNGAPAPVTTPAPAGTPTGATPFAGIAPGARIVNIKVGSVDGAVDVSQVIAAIDWVVANRNRNGLNIKVIALAYGTDTAATWRVDPLAHAADVARRNGLVVVAAAGNDGTSRIELASPALNQNIIAVGSVDMMGSTDPGRWQVADFANRGTPRRSPDFLTPGVSVVGLRVPGSFVDVSSPSPNPGDRYLRGSGTSQSAAVAAGLAALLIQRYPKATPAQVKAMLVSSAVQVSGVKGFQGAGAIVGSRLLKAAPPASGGGDTTTGTDPINSDRASGTLELNGVPLKGEIDVQGKRWSSVTWARTSAAGSTWKGGLWQGNRWTGDSFGPIGWTPTKWTTSWAGTPWNASNWGSNLWDFAGLRWRGEGWAGLRWRDASWSSLRWRVGAWS